MDITAKMEQFQKGYMRALCAACGWNTAEPYVDDDSVDLKIFGKTKDGSCVIRPEIEIQLKATLKQTVAKYLKEDGIHFPLKQKNYNDLCGDDYILPRYLLLLILPDNPLEWLPENRLATQQCYWLNLKNSQPNDNQTSTTVVFPTQQILTIETLNYIMQRAAQGDYYEHP